MGFDPALSDGQRIELVFRKEFNASVTFSRGSSLIHLKSGHSKGSVTRVRLGFIQALHGPHDT